MKRTILIGPSYNRTIEIAEKLRIPRNDTFTAVNPSNLQGWSRHTTIIVIDPYDWPHYSLNLLQDLEEIGATIMSVIQFKTK